MSTSGDRPNQGFSDIPPDEQFQPVGLDDPPGSASTIQEPPATAGGILRSIGPALIITASIVGSGELIATTKTGAVAGMSLMWLILVGCVIKVFVQIEFGRHSISHGITTLQALNSVPGPKLRVRWIVWFWVLMSLATIVQLGGIIGGVGQALALIAPISGDYREAIKLPSEAEFRHYEKWRDLIFKADYGYNSSNQRPPGMPAHPGPGLPGGRPADGAGANPGAGPGGGGAGAGPGGGIPGGGPGGPGGGRPRRPPADGGRPPMAFNRPSEPQSAGETAIADRSAKLSAASFSPAQAEEPDDDSDAQPQRQPPSRTNQGGTATAPSLPPVPPPHVVPPLEVGPPVGDPEMQEFLSKTPDDQKRLRASVKRMEEQREIVGSNRFDEAKEAVWELMTLERELQSAEQDPDASAGNVPNIEQQLAETKAEVKELLAPWTLDDKYWALMVALVTIALLYQGRYIVVQNVSTFLVVVFTFVTIGNVIALQSYADYSLSVDDFLKGFGIPQEGNGLFLALATFGIIGVGAAELVAYPYWCLEKGYARFAGPRTDDESWVRRAKGWIRVMKCDAFVSLVIYTIATMAFYLMGATVLYRFGLDPDGHHMVGTLAEQYVPVFGRFALPIFVVGVIAVLYSTVVAAVAGHSRTFTDCFKVFGLIKYGDEAAHRKSVASVCIFVPLIGLAVYCIPGANPVTLVLGGAVMQAFMLPLLAGSALYLRYRQTDPRICPGKLWDVVLIISCVGLLASGAGAVWKAIEEWG